MVKSRGNQGYALLLVLLVLALLVSVVQVIALKSGGCARGAILERQAIQEKWSQNSRDMLLKQVPDWISVADQSEELELDMTYHFSFASNRKQWDITCQFEDERNKFNVNAFTNEYSKDQMADLLEPMMGSGQIRLKPLGRFEREIHKVPFEVPYYLSYSQLTSAPWWHDGDVTEHVTLFGDSKIDYRKASEEVMVAVLSREFTRSEVVSLKELLDEGIEIEQAARDLEFNADQIRLLQFYNQRNRRGQISQIPVLMRWSESSGALKQDGSDKKQHSGVCVVAPVIQRLDRRQTVSPMRIFRYDAPLDHSEN